MGLRNWIDRYIITIGPGAQGEVQGGIVDASKVPLKADNKVGELDTNVDTAGMEKAASTVDTSFEKIFLLAQIPPPPQGYTIEKVAQMLQNPKLTNLSKENRAAAILVALDAQGVKIEQVIEDAARKDKALDMFEKVQRDHLKKFTLQKEDENKKLLAEIEEFIRQKQALIEQNKKSISKLDDQIKSWLGKKAQKEKELYEVVQNFTTENPISVDLPREQAAPVKITDLTKTFKK